MVDLPALCDITKNKTNIKTTKTQRQWTERDKGQKRTNTNLTRGEDEKTVLFRVK